jgi:16S rRNA (guanine527-N7)-methyltransferase
LTPAGRLSRRRAASPAPSLSKRQWIVLRRYAELVLAWGDRLNLTRTRTLGDAVRLLVLDALPLLPYLPPGGSIVDLGSGAGTPAIALAVARPESRFLLVEASRKKAGFLEVVCRELGLANVDVLHARAEDLGRMPVHRERYDAVTARAVADLAVLAEYAIPLLKVGGVALFPKGSRARLEAARAGPALALLGGAADVYEPARPPGPQIVVLRKMSPTPAVYPRRPGVPARRPLSAKDLAAASRPAASPRVGG